MKKNRLEAFSDGVIAIIITIMVLELKIPEGKTLAALYELRHVFVCYVLSFIFVGIYWNNHHHLIHTVKRVNGTILWANTHLLFWLSLVPFVTAWMGENHFEGFPVAAYGIVMLMAGIAYFILTKILIAHHGQESTLAQAIGKDYKGLISTILYAIAIPAAYVNTWISFVIYIGVAILWIIPDKRIEKHLSH